MPLLSFSPLPLLLPQPATADRDYPEEWILKIDSRDRPGLGKSQGTLVWHAAGPSTSRTAPPVAPGLPSNPPYLAFAGNLGRVEANNGVANPVGFVQARCKLGKIKTGCQDTHFDDQ